MVSKLTFKMSLYVYHKKYSCGIYKIRRFSFKDISNHSESINAVTDVHKGMNTEYIMLYSILQIQYSDQILKIE